MTPRRSLELDISLPLTPRTPIPPEQSPIGGGQNRRKKSREEKDSFLFSIFGSHSRPSSPSYDPSLNSMNNLAARSSKRNGLIRKHSAGNVKLLLPDLPDEDEPRRKSFDSSQPNMNTQYGDFQPPEEIAPWAYQTISSPDTRKGSSATLSSNSDANSYRHRRTKSSDSDSALDTSSVFSFISTTNPTSLPKEKEKKTILSKLFSRKNTKDKETLASEGTHRKNSESETFNQPIITTTAYENDFAPTTPTYNKSAPLTGKSDHYLWKSRKGNSGKKKETTPSEFNLDIDDMDMEGIIRKEHRLSGASNIIQYISCDEMIQESNDWTYIPSMSNSEMWSPPESWAVRKPQPYDQQIYLEHNIMDDIDNEKVNGKKLVYCIRIFRPDAIFGTTFGTVSCGLNTTTAELCNILGKKFFIQDISKYNLYIRRHNLERVLLPNERPFKLQKQLLEQAGYTENDKLDDLGREDNSYLVRFTFRETTVPRFEEEQGAVSSIQHVDLQARNLQTIPIFLYRQAYYIRSLNVSQNLMLDLPTDFIQSCHQLRELHLSQNELEYVPQSVRHSQMLSTLDLSSNRLRDLDRARDHDRAQLENISELTNLQVDNNLLKSLPESYVKFHNLNILNVANNSFEEFPPVICNITSLSELDISFNNIKSVPMEIGQLVNLKRLFLIGNQITSVLPTSFKDLVCLRELDIRRNQISNIDVLSSVPKLEILLAESNNVCIVNLSSSSLQKLNLSKNKLTQFSLAVKSSITDLSLAYSKLTELPEGLFEHLVSLEKLDLSYNQLTRIPSSIGHLKRLTHFSCTNNTLSELPNEISDLTALRGLDIHNNNLRSFPSGIWSCTNLVTLNASSNLLERFPIPPSSSTDKSNRPVSANSNSVRPNPPLSYSLRALYLGDNSLNPEVFSAISLFFELRILNLSFNDLDEVPTGGIANPHLTELYLSGNILSSLPDDIEKLTSLRILHINGNKLQTLPAELSKIRKLVVLDVGNNVLRYNIANWQYDWNWNWNLELKYLNLSGNKKLKIRHIGSDEPQPPQGRNLADFGALTKLRVLGLMDITLLNSTVPDEADNRRVRTSSSEVNNMAYGMADTLGTSDNLSTWEAVIPKFRGRENECLFGLFEGRAGNNRGGKVSKYLHDWFQFQFKTELDKLRDYDTVESALRRSFLSLNKELGLIVFNSNNTSQDFVESESTNSITLGVDDNKSGASGLVVYISGSMLYVANVGDTKAVIGRNGTAYEVACNKSAISPSEILRIGEAGGFISHDYLVNGEVDVPRLFGHFHLIPIINADPSIEKVRLSAQDEFIILATRGLWDRMSYQTAVDIARTERGDLMKAAQKLRDFAISYGAEESIMVMIIGVSDLFNRRKRGGPELQGTAYDGNKSKRGRKDENPNDSIMARLQAEIPPPKGEVALVFTDIKNSTFLWETESLAMRTAIKQHNSVMRRQLRTIGGYEVKTEGDAFMVAFPNVTSALLWCSTVQIELLKVDWPPAIIESEDGKEIRFVDDDGDDGGGGGGDDGDDDGGNLIYKGLSVRMGIHWGKPVCEEDIVTRRMDYFGPMVNKAARICNAADGGQICVSADAEAQIKLLNIIDSNSVFRKNSKVKKVKKVERTSLQSLQSTDGISDKNLINLKQLNCFIIQIGERKLKGLENPETLYLVYPEILFGRTIDRAKDRTSVTYQPRDRTSATYQPRDRTSATYQPRDRTSATYQTRDRNSATYQTRDRNSITYQSRDRTSATYQRTSVTYQAKDRTSATYQQRDRISKIHDSPVTQQILNPKIVREIGFLCLKLERLSSGSSSTRNSKLDYLPGLTYYVKDNASDDELLRVMESLITRIENSISTLYLTHFGKLALGDASTVDIIKALHVYAQYLGKAK